MNVDMLTSKRLRSMKENFSKDSEVNSHPSSRTLHVEAVGVVRALPDLCHILIRISSQKLTISQAKDSVQRRLAYIKQTIQNCQIQESEIKIFHSVEAGYTHTTEIFVTNTDVSKLYELSEILTQKLDESVSLSPVTFSISNNALAHCRSQSASNAVQNARKKAAEMARLVEGSLGSPISIEQLTCDETPIANINNHTSMSQFGAWQQASLQIKSSVRILFELKPRKIG